MTLYVRGRDVLCTLCWYSFHIIEELTYASIGIFIFGGTTVTVMSFIECTAVMCVRVISREMGSDSSDGEGWYI